MIEVGEVYWAVPDDGDKVRCLTPALALSALLKLGPGKVVCESHIDPAHADSWVVMVVHPDGHFEPMAAPGDR